MTFSLLNLDKNTGTFAGATATGNLCVGGWVLRGQTHVGMTASQGAEPSVLWGEEALIQMQKGLSAPAAVDQVTRTDPRREWRQMAAIDGDGTASAFSGEQNGSIIDEIVENGLILTGNILSNKTVLARMRDTFFASDTTIEDKLIAALRAGAGAGGDSRGLMSAALLVLPPDAPPLTLRVDFDEAPIDRLEALLQKTRDPAYRAWLETLPTYPYPNADGLTQSAE
ncbi:MAG: DUF1028 domain-containing protein [Paracoccaceae bacterium]